jgi:hypothetical protein
LHGERILLFYYNVPVIQRISFVPRPIR